LAVRTPDHIRISDDKFIRDTPRVSLHLGKSSSYEVLDNFVMGNEIGKGAYATVRSAQNKDNNSKVAIKIYDKFKLLTPSRKKNAEREIKILTKLNHPNIIKLYKTVENKKSLNLVLEYVSGCSLMSYLKKRHNKKLDEPEARRIFKQIIQGLDHCHNLNITHRDIKLDNILIDSHHCVKIIDFGFSTCFSNDKKVRLFCGTPSYMSPEIVTKQESHGPPSDIWAAGVVLYVLLTGTFPFKATHSKELYSKIQRGVFFTPSGLSQEATSLINAMLNIDPLKRPTAKGILEHQWFKERAFKTYSLAERPREVPQVRVNLNNTFDCDKGIDM
jgi:MAP/microtubule affinity-regulating kinase